MGLLAAFLENEKSESTLATVATPATIDFIRMGESQLSRRSQVATAKTEIACQRIVATVATLAGADDKNAILEALADASLEPDDVEHEERVSQKSSVLQPAKSVSQMLTPDTESECRLPTDFC